MVTSKINPDKPTDYNLVMFEEFLENNPAAFAIWEQDKKDVRAVSNLALAYELFLLRAEISETIRWLPPLFESWVTHGVTTVDGGT